MHRCIHIAVNNVWLTYWQHFNTIIANMILIRLAGYRAMANNVIVLIFYTLEPLIIMIH